MITRTKVPNRKDTNKFVNILKHVMPQSAPRDNGSKAGVSALAASLKRTDAYLKAQQNINDKCLVGVCQSDNTLKEAV